MIDLPVLRFVTCYPVACLSFLLPVILYDERLPTGNDYRNCYPVIVSVIAEVATFHD